MRGFATMLLALTLVGQCALAQPNVGIQAGFGLGHMRTSPSEGGRFSRPVLSFEVGGSLSKVFQWGIFGLEPQSGLRVSRLGATDLVQRASGALETETETTVSLLSLALPVVVNIRFSIQKTALYLGAGVQLGLGMIGHILQVETTTGEGASGVPKEQTKAIHWGNEPGQVQRLNLGLVGQVGFEFLERMHIIAYYHLGLTGIAHFTDIPPYSHTHTYGLGFRYNFL